VFKPSACPEKLQTAVTFRRWLRTRKHEGRSAFAAPEPTRTTRCTSHDGLTDGLGFDTKNTKGDGKMFQRPARWNGLLAIVVMIFASSALALPGSPNFGPALWGDGQLWGSKGAAMLPPPNDYNLQSFDKLYIVTNSNNPDGQLPVAEAAPGNPNFNGGRWFSQTVEWTADAFTDLGTVPVLTSYDAIVYYFNLGYLTITPGHPDPTSPTFFECPLLPVH
jgi:hypothetical protein